MRRALALAALAVALGGACGSRVVFDHSAPAGGPRSSAAEAARPGPVIGAGHDVTESSAPGTVDSGRLTPATSAPVAAAAPPLTVSTVGNGILYDIEPAIRASLGTAGFFNHSMGGFGISVLPEVWHGVLGKDVPSDQADVVIVMLGQRDFPVALADPGTYRAELDEAVRLLSSRGARILWLGLPPQPPTMLDDAGRRAVNALFAELPGRFPGVVRYVPTDPVLAAADGSFARSLPGPDGTLLPVRKQRADGVADEHICPDGAVRVAELVRTELAAAVTVPEPQLLWQSAEWRAEPRYDDPVGGCRL
jgi:hypothetical protein